MNSNIFLFLVLLAQLYFASVSKRGTAFLLVGAVMTSALVTAYPTQAETGKGNDVFKVIMTIFDVDKSKGDIVAMITVNDGEESRVKFLEADAPYVRPLNFSNSHFIEYVATFPNVNVNPGEEYKACVLQVKNLELLCTTGNNSPATRPEFVDLSLNATTQLEQAVIQEENGENESEESFQVVKDFLDLVLAREQICMEDGPQPQTHPKRLLL